MIRRAAVLLLLLLCTACGPGQPVNPPNPTAAALPAPPPSACQIGPNDGPVLAERGIGGTGMPAFAPAAPASGTQLPSQTGQDRGIGGTGAAPASSSPKAAMGNTGIVGEITGFASVCLNGVEVAYDPATSVEIDGQTESPAALRAGQIAAIVASPDAGAPEGLRAGIVAIRHEVAGPVSSVDADNLTIAGQRVIVKADTRGLRRIALGDWVAVSGFRNHGGAIVATRIDPQPPGAVTVHGIIVEHSGRFRIGQLNLRLPPVSRPLRNGEAVTAIGMLDGSELDVASISPDLLYSDPQAYFGPSVKRLLLESYVYSLGGPIYVAVGTSIYLAEGKLFYNPSGLSIYSLVVSPHKTLRAAGKYLGKVGGALNPFGTGPVPMLNPLGHATPAEAAPPP